MSDGKWNFKPSDLSSEIANSIRLLGPVVPGSHGGTFGELHLQVVVENNQYKVKEVPIQHSASPSGGGYGPDTWGPCPATYRSKEYVEPYAQGQAIVYYNAGVDDTGAAGEWEEERGFIDRSLQVATALFGSDGSCIRSGYVGNGAHWSVGGTEADGKLTFTDSGLPSGDTVAARVAGLEIRVSKLEGKK